MKKQNGFAVLEGLLILIIVGILAGTGLYVMKARNNADKTLSSATNTSQANVAKKTPAKSNSSASTTQSNIVNLEFDGKNVVSLSAPYGWISSVAHATNSSSDQRASCSITATNSLISLDYGSATPKPLQSSINGLVEFDFVKQPDSKSLQDYFTDDLYGGYDSGYHTFTDMIINGNPATLYDGGSSQTDPNGYRQQFYLVAHAGYVACLSWRYYDGTSNDYSSYIGTVKSMAKSVKFL